MSAQRDLPARPSLDSLRKQAKKLARDVEAGQKDAVARVHAQFPKRTLPLSIRDAQLVIAREYGFPGWADLTAEVHRRVGGGVEWAASQAKVAIDKQDHDRLRALLTEFPALVSWRNANGATLFSSTLPYALDCSDPKREELYTRPIAAEMLIDAGVTVDPSSWEYLIATGSSGMLHLLARKRVLPQTLPVLAALGDEPAVRARLEELRDSDTEASSDGIARALLNASRFTHQRIALALLDRAIGLDPELGRRIDRWQSRQAFVDFLIQYHGSYSSNGPTEGGKRTLWQAFVIRQVMKAQDTNDLPAFRRWLSEEPWLLQPAFIDLHNRLIERASYGKGKEAFITAFLELEPALLHANPPPRSSAIAWALSYGNGHLIPILTRIWPVPDDLPHAAGTGNAAAVARWFDADGKLALGSLPHHYPASDPQFKGDDLGWASTTPQQVLDIALAWAVLNHHFEIASFLLQRGADINTNWSTHEPASILHEAAINGNEDAVRFLVDHGADLDKEDFRYQSTAEGWARYGANDAHMADLLAAARRAREG